MSEGGSREGGDLGGVGTGTLVSSDPQGLLCAAEKLDPAGGVCVCADQEGCVYCCVVGPEVTAGGGWAVSSEAFGK